MKSPMLYIPAALLLASCGGGSRHSPVAEAQSRPIAVHTAEVCLEEWPDVYQATGTVRARSTATISSKVMGYVKQVNVQVGDRVRESQPLVTLDARDLEVNLLRAEAGRAEVESSVPEAEGAVAAAKAQFDLAQATYQRMEGLAAQKSISNQEFDEASARRKAAEANYQMARARRTQLDSKRAQADQEVRAAGIVRDYANVVAPFAGIVTARLAEPGSLATPGAPLLTLEQGGAYRLEATVEESQMASIRLGQKARVLLDAADLEARVSEIAPSLDPASRSAIVKIDLPAAAGLRSGMFGRAEFALGVQKVLSIPAGGLVERGQLHSVWVVEQGLARVRLVTVGRRIQGKVEILSGAGAGDAVIVPVPPGLEDGARVEVRP